MSISFRPAHMEAGPARRQSRPGEREWRGSEEGFSPTGESVISTRVEVNNPNSSRYANSRMMLRTSCRAFRPQKAAARSLAKASR